MSSRLMDWVQSVSWRFCDLLPALLTCDPSAFPNVLKTTEKKHTSEDEATASDSEQSFEDTD